VGCCLIQDSVFFLVLASFGQVALSGFTALTLVLWSGISASPFREFLTSLLAEMLSMVLFAPSLMAFFRVFELTGHEIQPVDAQQEPTDYALYASLSSCFYLSARGLGPFLSKT
jgi:hypothetical protein